MEKDAEKLDTATSQSKLSDGLVAAADWLDEAADDIEHWASYASEYSQQKYGATKDVKMYRERAETIRKKAGN